MAYIEFRNISKIYGDCVACRDVSMSVEKNTVHALIGENGAGKSTVMKLLGGIDMATSGEMFLNGKAYAPQSAQDAFKNKIAFIHQHFVLAEQLTALDNLLLSYSSDRFSLQTQNKAEVRAKAEKLLQTFNWTIPLNKIVKDISVGEQQRLEILKALLQDPDIIIFDEPTAVLTPQESDELLKFIEDLRLQQKTVILISHKLNEIKHVADNVSVMRGGRHVETRKNSDLSLEQMAELMIGRRIQRKNTAKPIELNEVLFKIPKSSISLNKGEIFGVAGIEGNGQSQLIASILGEFKHLQEVQPDFKFGDITEDRLKLSVFNELDLSEHMLLKHTDDFTDGRLINKTKLKEASDQLVEKWDVRPRDSRKALSEFSGGNQQKFVVGRELWNNPNALLAAHPTRGVDLGAQEMIHNTLLEFAAQKNTVVLISSDLNELLYLSDRYIILNKNKIYGPFAKNELSEKEIGIFMAADLGHESTRQAGEV